MVSVNEHQTCPHEFLLIDGCTKLMMVSSKFSCMMCLHVLSSTAVLANSTCGNDTSCEQNCAVVNGTEQCSCNVGYMLADDETSCQGNDVIKK